MVKQDIPNTVLGRFLSLEMLGMIVIIGISWGTLTAKVTGLESHIEETKETHAKERVESKTVTDELSREVNQINRKVDVLGNNQEHFKRQIDSVDDRLEKIQQLLEQGNR